ncbi:rRNA pseudouridine synthase [Candidatus Woesearchaeota archaeon]|nr:rRNA pseudouridine synthase [Candidatus Woesearchaeota archaeon]
MKQNLYQYLAQSGLFGNRKEILRALKKGKVKIDGRKVTRPKFQFNPNTRQVTYNDKPVQPLDFVYYAINKPLGYVSQKNDYQKRPFVLDLLKGKADKKILNSLALAGRLDVDTSGLMIATNDGSFIHRLMSPGNVIKRYEATLDKAIQEQDIQKVKQGVLVKAEDETYTAKANVYSAKGNKLVIGITEGRKRQIRLMFKALGYEATSLKRIAIGRIGLQHLKEGEFMVINPRNV